MLDEAREMIKRTEQRFYEPEMHRWRGIVLCSMNRPDDAFRTAVAVAEGQGSIT